MKHYFSTAILLVSTGAWCAPLSQIEAAVWVGGAENRWSIAANWQPGPVPNAVGAVADFSAIDILEGTVVTLDGNKTAGTLTFGDIVPSNDWILSPGTPATSTLTLDVSTGSPVIKVVNQAATLKVPIDGSDGLTKSGFGSLILTRSNTYSGTTTVREGNLKLDFADNGVLSDIIPGGSDLRLAGGEIVLVGLSGASNSQAFIATTVQFGGNSIVLEENGAASLELALGLVLREAGGVLDLTLPARGRIRFEGVTPSLNGILGGWATVETETSSTWASNDGAGNIVPYVGFTELIGAPAIPHSRDVNYRWSQSTGDATLGTGTTEINSILFTDAARRTIIIPDGGTLRMGATGGILKADKTAGEAESLLMIGSAGTFLTAGEGENGGELILHANSVSASQNGMVVHSAITDNGAGPVTLVKSGNASGLLAADNTYTNGTYIAQGRLRTSKPGAFGTGPVYVAGSAQAYLDAGTVSNSFFLHGSGLAGGNDPTASGALRVAGNNSTASGMITLLGDAQIGGGADQGHGGFISGQITGPFSLGLESGTNGILTLTNSGNDWSGNTIIGPGVLRIGGAGEVVPHGQAKGNVILDGDASSNSVSVLDLNGRNETVNGFSSVGFHGQTLIRNSGSTAATLTFGTNQSEAYDFAGSIQDGIGTVGLKKIHEGVQTLSGSNTYSGPTVIEGGTLRLGSSQALPAETQVSLGGAGRLDLAGNDAAIFGLSSIIGGVVFNSSAARSALTVSGASTYAGTIAGDVELRISGGFLHLSRANSFSGPTTINDGQLFLTGSLAPTGDVILNGGATLSVSGNAMFPNTGVVGNVIMQPGSRLVPAGYSDDSSGTGTMTTLIVNGGDMRFTLGDRIAVLGAADFRGPSTITPGTMPLGTHTLLTAGSLEGAAPILDVPPNTRTAYALSFDTQGDQIRLNVAGSPSKILTWTGANASEWDVATTANWTDGTMAETFFNRDLVRFTDGPVNQTISLNTTVFPRSVIIDNSAETDYVIDGTGGIADSKLGGGTGLTKSGTGSFTLGGTNTYSGATGVVGGVLRITGTLESEGQVNVIAPAKFIVNGTASVRSVLGTGGIVGAGSTEIGNGLTSARLTTDFIRQAALTIGHESSVQTRMNGGTSLLGELSIAGNSTPTATLDLNNNAVAIEYTGPSPVETIRAQISAGRGGPGFGAMWTGQGITSSAVAAAAATEPESQSIGYAENASLPLGAYTAFRGEKVDDTSVLMAFTRTGDANLDGVVNDDDVTIVSATYAPGVPQPSWALGDFDYNGFVDDDDVTLLGVFYDPSAQPLVTPAPVSAGAMAAVPEPASAALLVIAGLAAALVARTMRRRQPAPWRAISRWCRGTHP